MINGSAFEKIQVYFIKSFTYHNSGLLTLCATNWVISDNLSQFIESTIIIFIINLNVIFWIPVGVYLTIRNAKGAWRRCHRLADRVLGSRFLCLGRATLFEAKKAPIRLQRLPKDTSRSSSTRFDWDNLREKAQG